MTYIIPEPPKFTADGNDMWKWMAEVSKVKTPRYYRITWPTSGAAATYTLATIPTYHFATELTNNANAPSLSRLEIVVGGYFQTSLSASIQITTSPSAFTYPLPSLVTGATVYWNLKLELYAGRANLGAGEGNYIYRQIYTYSDNTGYSKGGADYLIAPTILDPNTILTNVNLVVSAGTCLVNVGHIATHPAS